MPRSGWRTPGTRWVMDGAVSELRDYYDDRSQSWQESERGEEHQERIASVEAVLDAIDELIR
jgi:hypothetical protein